MNRKCTEQENKLFDKIEGLLDELKDNVPKQTDLTCTTYRNERTRNGYTVDVVKSAIQKYSRRGMFSECVYAMVEMYLFKFHETGKSLYTNFCNRIKVVCLEDISLNLNGLVYLNKLLTDLGNEREVYCETIVKIADFLCNTLKCRMYSHLRILYSDKVIDVPEEKSKFSIELKDSTVTEYTNALILKLENDDTEAFYWMNKIITSDKKLEKKYYRSSDIVYFGFYVLDEFFKHYNVDPRIIEICTVCRGWYKKFPKTESNLCLFYPLMVYVFRNRIGEVRTDTEFKETEYKEIISKNMNGIKMEFHPFIYDKHTKIGKKSGKTSSDFAIEGSLVAFEDAEILNENAKQKYIEARLSEGKIKKESEEFKLKARAQLTTSFCRQDVYYAKDSNCKNVVVKGPFEYSDANKIFQLTSVMRFFDKINVIETNLKILIPDLFKNVPVGYRNKIKPEKHYVFLVFEDLLNEENYPVIIKNSKLWKDEPCIDNESVMNERRNFAVPSSLSARGKLSLFYQLAIRYAFEMGDFAARNFMCIDNVVYNLDITDTFVGNTMMWKESERKIMMKTYTENKEEINEVLDGWVKNTDWNLVKRILSLSDDSLTKIKNNILYISDNFCKWFDLSKK